MNQRVNPFEATLKDLPTFGLKPKPEAHVAKDDVDRIADDTGFVSRQPVKPAKPKEQRRKARTYRTGRNVQFNAKVTSDAAQRFYKLADERKVVLGELLEQGLDALEALGELQKVANREGVSLKEIVDQAIEALG